MIHLILFASARRLLGASELELEAGAGACVGDLLANPHLALLAPQAASLRFAVNEEFASLERKLCEGDTVAVIPPVSGG